MSAPQQIRTFNDLPTWAKRLILEKALVTSDATITNPWMLHNLDDDDNIYKPYDWCRGLNIDILCTSKEIHELGVKLLYESNIFRFTRLVDEQECGTVRLQRFLAKKISVFSSNGPARLVPIASLIRRVVIHNSDVDSDALASRGYAQPLLDKPDAEQFPFVGACLRRLKSLNCQLLRLTITVDEQVEGVVESIEACSASGGGENMVASPDYTKDISGSNNERALRTMAWNSMHSSVASVAASAAHAPVTNSDGKTTDDKRKTETRGRGDDEFSVELFIVRGSISQTEDSRQMVPAGALGATALETWLSTHGIRPNAVRYTGPFTKRILLPDGSLPPTLEMEIDESENVEVSEGSGSIDDQRDEEAEDSDDDEQENGEDDLDFVDSYPHFVGNHHLDAAHCDVRHIGWRLDILSGYGA
ncbi:hypothetical protein DL98DRAFT_533787 [Cadophora sp. DSE1049]|nr:hypothetical protein DL98DRAFT_533787 [Cadophora sp. DSE1049]